MTWLLERLKIEDILTGIVSSIPMVVAAVAVLLLFWLLYRLTRVPLKLALERAGLHPALTRTLVESIFRVTVLVFALVMAAAQLGIDVGAALAGIGVAGLAVGFAAQDSLANVIAGFTIFLDKPFQVGDWVTVADQYGEVSGITVRSTRIRTPNNTYVVIPNKTIIDAVLVNHSKHGSTRVDVPVGIAYKEYIPRAREVLLRAVANVGAVVKTPAPDVVVTELGDSSVNLAVRVWIDDAAKEAATRVAVVEASKLALDEAGIQIPFPHLQLFIDDVEDRVWSRAAHLASAGRGRSDHPA